MTEYQTLIDSCRSLPKGAFVRLVRQLVSELPRGPRSFLLLTLEFESLDLGDSLTPTQIARLCDCSASTVCRWIDTGKLRGFRVQREMEARVTGPSLSAFLRGSQQDAGETTREFGTKTVFSSSQAAEILGVSAGTVSAWVRDGKLDGYFVKTGAERRVLADDFAEFAQREGFGITEPQRKAA